MADQDKKGKLNIELPEEVATGVYANLAVITHSPAEFVMDFIQVMRDAQSQGSQPRGDVTTSCEASSWRAG